MLQAASFGKSFDVEFDSDSFVDVRALDAAPSLPCPAPPLLVSCVQLAVFPSCILDWVWVWGVVWWSGQVCKKLRVMNAVRRFEVGIPITFMQYEVLTAEVLLERLQQRCVTVCSTKVQSVLRR